MLATKIKNIEALNDQFEAMIPQEIVRWAVETFRGRIAVTSSFGPESGTLLHMISQVDPAVPVLFLDTGYHFPETLEYKERLTVLFGLKNVVSLRAKSDRKADVVARYDGVPYEKNPDLCCQINKVEPLDEALRGFDAWMSGIRRHQTDFRKSIRIIEEYEGGVYKISPFANLTSREAWQYLKGHQIPQHPLSQKGYLSIGCWPCTRPIQAGDDERSGRWAGKSKKECGIHTFKEISQKNSQVEKEVSENLSPDI